MSKKKLIRVNQRRRPPWGATKATAKVLAKEREVANEIHGLKSEITGLGVVINNLVRDRDKFRRLLDGVASPVRIAALRRVCLIPLSHGVDLGVEADLVKLCVWLSELDGGVIENVRQALAQPLAPATKPNAEPLMPRPSGITMMLADHDDPDSVDDLFAKAVDIHLERMDRRHYWIGLTPIGGETVHIDITQKRNEPIRARVRK